MKTQGNERIRKILRFAEQEITTQIKLTKNSPLVKWGRKFFGYKMPLAYAIAKAEFKKVWTGREYVVFLSDDHTRFFVFSEREMGGILYYAKKRLFMRRPEMRQRIVYRTAC